MSPRKAKPKRNGKRDITHDDERELSTSNESIEEHDDGIFVVRKISGSSSNKPYRCPGCDQIIPRATSKRRRWPPDNSLALAFIFSLRPTSSITCSTSLGFS